MIIFIIVLSKYPSKSQSLCFKEFAIFLQKKIVVTGRLVGTELLEEVEEPHKLEDGFMTKYSFDSRRTLVTVKVRKASKI